MIQYNLLNIKLSNSQPNKLKSAIKYGTNVTVNLSSNIAGDANDENNLPHKLLLSNTQSFCIWFISWCKTFKNLIA